MTKINAKMSPYYQELELKNLDAYLQLIGKKTDYHIEKCFASGMPRVWMYYRALGLEEKFFDLVHVAQEPGKFIYYRDLIYALILTQGQSKFVTEVPSGYLKLDLPQDIVEAQIQIQAPDFQIAYTFSDNQLKDTLKIIAQPGKMISLGDKLKSIGLMLDADGKYLVYHIGNPAPLSFKTLDGCVDSILRYISGTDQKTLGDLRVPMYIERCDLEGRMATPAPKTLEMLKDFNATNNHDYNKLTVHGVDPLYLAVRAGLIEQVNYWREQGVSFGRTYNVGTNLLSLAVHDRNKEMVNLLLQHPDISDLKAATLDILKHDHNGLKLLHECTSVTHHERHTTFLPSKKRT